MSVPATSLAAYHSLGAIPASLGDEICNLLELAGPDGLISDDIFACLSRSGRNDSSITTRYSELEEGKRIYRDGDIGCGMCAFCKVYASVQSFNLQPGDKVSVAYTLEIN